MYAIVGYLSTGKISWINFNSLFLKTLRPGQNGRRFADDTFKRIFLNENVWISIKISLKFVPNGPINNIPALVQIMAWHRSGDKPLYEPMMVSLPTHICVTWPQWVKYCRSWLALVWVKPCNQRVPMLNHHEYNPHAQEYISIHFQWYHFSYWIINMYFAMMFSKWSWLFPGDQWVEAFTITAWGTSHAWSFLVENNVNHNQPINRLTYKSIIPIIRTLQISRHEHFFH